MKGPNEAGYKEGTLITAGQYYAAISGATNPVNAATLAAWANVVGNAKTLALEITPQVDALCVVKVHLIAFNTTANQAVEFRIYSAEAPAAFQSFTDYQYLQTANVARSFSIITPEIELAAGTTYTFYTQYYIGAATLKIYSAFTQTYMSLQAWKRP